MAIYTKNSPGEPTSGLYNVFDVVVDSVGVAWQCVVGGVISSDPHAHNFVAAPMYREPAGVVAARGTIGAGGALGTLMAEEFGSGPFTHLRLTMAAHSVAILNTNAYGSSLLYTLPEGRIWVFGAQGTIAIATPGTRSGLINDNSTIDWAVGSAAASNVALTSTMVDLVDKEDEKAFAATGNGYSTTTTSVLSTAFLYDGHTTAMPVYLNFGFSDANDIDNDAIVTVNGYIDLVYVNLGDY